MTSRGEPFRGAHRPSQDEQPRHRARPGFRSWVGSSGPGSRASHVVALGLLSGSLGSKERVAGPSGAGSGCSGAARDHASGFILSSKAQTRRQTC